MSDVDATRSNLDGTVPSPRDVIQEAARDGRNKRNIAVELLPKIDRVSHSLLDQISGITSIDICCLDAMTVTGTSLQAVDM